MSGPAAAGRHSAPARPTRAALDAHASRARWAQRSPLRSARPAAYPRSPAFAALSALGGDRGARAPIAARGVEVAVAFEDVAADIDTREELAAANRAVGPVSRSPR